MYIPLQSLANVLVVLRRRLGELSKVPHTHEDLQHFRVGGGCAATPPSRRRRRQRPTRRS